MAAHSGPEIVNDGLVFYYDMDNPQKSFRGAPTFNASLQNGQNDVSPWGGDGAPTSLGIDPIIKFRGRKVAKFQTGTSGNCYLNGTVDLSPSINSTVWTSTFYLKRVDSAVISTVGMYLYVTGNTNVNTTVTVTPVEDGWYKAVYTRSGLVSGYPTLTGMFSLGAATQYYFADWQCENLSISTPWVTGTRSNTESIIDLTNNNTVTANSLTYAADGSFGFNGTTDFASFGNGALINSIGGTSSITVEVWVRYNSYVGSGGSRTYSVVTHKGSPWTWLMENPSNRGRIRFTIGGADVNCSDPDVHPLNTWMNWVGTYDGANMRFFRNGILKNTVARTGTLGSNSINAQIGQFSNDYRMDGNIGILKIHNQALSAQEVQQNFNALRGRYGI